MIKKYLIFFMLFLLVVGVVGCGNKQVTKQEDKKVPVETAAAKKMDLSKDLAVTGEILPETDVQVAPKVIGRVTSVPVKVCDTVKQGQVLFTLEDTDYRSNFRNAAATLKVAQANYNQNKKQYERMKILFEEGAIASTEMEQTEISLATVEAQLEQAQAAYDAAKENLDNATIIAPVAGQVAAVNIEVGEMAGSQAALVSIIDMQVAKVKVNLSEYIVAQVKVGQKVKITVDALNKTVEGTVSTIAPSIDPASRAFPAEISIANPGGELRGGMVARLQLPVEQVNNALVVSTAAIIELDGADRVFIVEKGVAKERSVTTGISSEKYTQILSGLKEGEEVIVKGNRLVGEGQKVTVLKKDKTGGAGK